MSLSQYMTGRLVRMLSGRGIGKSRLAKTMHTALFNRLAPKRASSIHVNGMVMSLPNPESRMSRLIAFTGDWEPFETRLVKRHVGQGMSVIDCGANAGYYTLLLSKLVGSTGSVFAFEPSPETFKLLEQNIRRNNLTNVIPSPAAITDGATLHKALYIDPELPGQDSIADLGTDVKCEVICRSLDYYFGFRRVDFVKMDIQGAEYLALLGMKEIIRSNPQLKMIIEYAPGWIRRAGGDPDEFVRNLLRDFAITCCQWLGSIDSISDDDTVNLFCERRA